MASDYTDTFCLTCKRWFHHLGIARHRSAHRDKKENCTIMYKDGTTKTHKFESTEEKHA